MSPGGGLRGRRSLNSALPGSTPETDPYRYVTGTPSRSRGGAYLLPGRGGVSISSEEAGSKCPKEVEA